MTFSSPTVGGDKPQMRGDKSKFLSPPISMFATPIMPRCSPHQMGEEKTFPPPSVSVPCDFHPLKWLDAMRFLTHFFSPIGAFCLSPPTVGGGGMTPMRLTLWPIVRELKNLRSPGVRPFVRNASIKAICTFPSFR